MVWLPDAEKNEGMIIRFDRIHKRDRQTDIQAPHDGIGRACVASRGKNRPDVRPSVRSQQSTFSKP